MTQYKGQLQGFPTEIVEAMLDEQERQGNKRDVRVFEEYRDTTGDDGGFDWDVSDKGFDVWFDVITDRNYARFYETPKRIINKSEIAEKFGIDVDSFIVEG